MLSSILSLTLVSVAVFQPALAFDDINVARSAVKAGESFEVTFDSSSFDEGFDSTRVYLAITVPGWGTGPSCYLVNSTTSKSSVTVSIPASVGESGEFYSISTMEFNTDPNLDGPSGFEYSDDFSLSGGTGEWSEYELSGHTVGDADYLPCTAYDCARKCSQKYYTSDMDNLDDSAASKLWEKMDNCISSCPGVTTPDDSEDEEDDASSDSDSDDENDDVSVSASASSGSTTASSTSAHATSASATATATGAKSSMTSSVLASTTGSASSSKNGTANSTTTSSPSSPAETGAASARQVSGLAALVTIMGSALLLLL